LELELMSVAGLGMAQGLVMAAALGLPSVLALLLGAWVLRLEEVVLGWAEEWAQTLRWRR
jgi:hypothetical protein